MDYGSEATMSVNNTISSSPIPNNSLASPNSPTISPSNPPSPPPIKVVVSPCAACKTLRRRCVEKCVLAPYFPTTDPAKFAIAHRVFGASNIIKFLQDLSESQRADAVTSIVYEASARIRDPVYGSAGAICQLQKQVNELQAQVAIAQAELLNLQCQRGNLVSLLCMQMIQSSPQPHLVEDYISATTQKSHNYHNVIHNNPCFIDDSNYVVGSMLEPLST